MSLRQKIVPILGAVALTALSLTGCYEGKDGLHYLSESSKQKADAEIIPQEDFFNPTDYFARMHMWSKANLTMTSGDFNKDGNLDFVVGASPVVNNQARLYFFEGDGKGKFKLKKYSQDELQIENLF